MPKLMPTTVGREDTSMGASAEPLGCVAIVGGSEEGVGGDEVECAIEDRFCLAGRSRRHVHGVSNI